MVGFLKGAREPMHLPQDPKEMQELVGFFHLKRLVQRTWMSPLGCFPHPKPQNDPLCVDHGRSDVPTMKAVVIVHRLES